MPHTFTKLHYHLVFATKQRMPLITPAIQERLYRYVGGTIREHRGSLIEIGGVADHIHILAGFLPRYPLSEMLKTIKGGASHWVNEQSLCSGTFAWQKGYAAFTVSTSQLSKTCRYIRLQEEHHRNRSFQEELDALLRRHGIVR
ncbi:MAG: IS200/IS605 family transposase [Thermoanaerobaculia bacterium]